MCRTMRHWVLKFGAMAQHLFWTFRQLSFCIVIVVRVFNTQGFKFGQMPILSSDDGINISEPEFSFH